MESSAGLHFLCIASFSVNAHENRLSLRLFRTKTSVKGFLHLPAFRQDLRRVMFG